jgi:hypothetical protein
VKAGSDLVIDAADAHGEPADDVHASDESDVDG